MGIDAERGGAARRVAAPKSTPTMPLPAPKATSIPQTLETLFTKIGTTPDDRLMDFMRTVPPEVAERALQDPKLDLARAVNPSAYLMGVLQRHTGEVSGSKRARNDAATGYEGGRARGGKKQKAPAATADIAPIEGANAARSAANSAATSAGVSLRIGGTSAVMVDAGLSAVSSAAPSAVTSRGSGEYVEAAGSRKKARGGAASKQRREEARRLKQAQQVQSSG